MSVDGYRLGRRQLLILLALPEGVALTTTGVAGLIGRPRNNTWASLDALRRRGMVDVVDGLWCATEIGDRAVRR